MHSIRVLVPATPRHWHDEIRLACAKALGIPTFEFPDTAARAFTNMWHYTYNLRGIYETPEPADETDAVRRRDRRGRATPSCAPGERHGRSSRRRCRPMRV